MAGCRTCVGIRLTAETELGVEGAKGGYCCVSGQMLACVACSLARSPVSRSPNFPLSTEMRWGNSDVMP